MRGFIAGAATTGPSKARAVCERTLSASPCASFPSVLAESGAITNTSAPVRCGYSSRGASRRASASKVLAATKVSASGVRMGVSSCPALTKRRASSAALYAAIPPVTPRSTRAMSALCLDPPEQGNHATRKPKPGDRSSVLSTPEGKEAMSRRTLVAAIAVIATALFVVGVAQSQGSATKLKGTVGPGFTIKLTKSGKKVTSLKAGKYSFAITDKSSIHDFTLEQEKGGKFEKHLTSVPATGSKTVTVKLEKGKWKYYCSAHESQIFGFFTVK